MYHEHLYYYTITSLSHLLSKHGLKIIDVERVPIHSGSLRVIATKNTSINANSKVNELIQLEYNYHDLSNFSLSIENSLKDLKLFLNENKNKKIIGYGASGRANVVVGTLDLDETNINYILIELTR